MDLYTGARVKLTLRDTNVIIGYINYINTNEDDSIVALSKVEIWEKGQSADKTRLPGVQRYQASEIENIEILPETHQKTAQKNAKATNLKCTGKNVKYSKRTPSHLRSLTELEPEKLIFGKCGSGSDEELMKTVFQQNGKSSDYDSGSEVEDSYTTEEFTVLTKTDKLFHEAIAFISDKPVIGFSAEGVDIGRDGKLCWIQIDVSGSIFLFDVLKLGDDCFEHGLKSIIQSASILKVIHDCRLLSDLLHHQYAIQMLNIFDTQVAHVLAYREQNNKDLPRYVPGLASCLYEHLDLPNEQIHIMRIREQAKSEDQEIWAERPAPKWLLEAASKHVKHLMDLRLLLMEKMMVEFIAGVEIYLTYVRSSSDKEAKDCQSKRHLLPLAFKHLHNFVSDLQRRMKHNYSYNKHPSDKDVHGFQENHIGVIDPKIVASKDSVWHANTDGSVIVNKRIKFPPADIKRKQSSKCVNVSEQQQQQTEPKEVEHFDSCKEEPSVKMTEMKKLFGVSGPETDEDVQSQISDIAFMHKMPSPVEIPKSNFRRGKLTSFRSEIEATHTDSDSLKGIILIPAGQVQDNNSRKRKDDSQYIPHISAPSDISDEDLRDYGVIPTPQRLGRATKRPVSPLSSLEHSVTSKDASAASSSNDLARMISLTNSKDILSSPSQCSTNEYSSPTFHEHISSKGTSIKSCDVVPKQEITSNIPNLNELQKQLIKYRQHKSSEALPDQNRLQKYFQLMKLDSK